MQLSPLLLGKQTKQSPGRPLFPLRFVGVGVVVVEEGVAGIDLHDVMDNHHFQDAQEFDGGVSMFVQHESHQRQMPAMLGGVFVATTVYEVGPPENTLKPVHFKNEV